MDNDSCSYIKWPNDVFLSHKKIAGLLTESVFSGNTFDRLIIGIGLNVNQQAFPDPLQDTATSIRSELGGHLNREQLLCNLLKRIEYKYNLWQRKQETLVKTINRSIRGYGQWVQMNVDGILQDESYKLLGINEEGKLLMLDHDGKINSYSYEQIQLITD